MKKIFLAILSSLLLCLLPLTISCSGEDKLEFNDEYVYEDYIPNNISIPSFDKYLTTTDTDGFSIRLRFTNGGDEWENMTCLVYWRAYSSKPIVPPTERDLTKCESMRIYSHTKTKTTFDKSHAGYNGGTYIYYYAECENSKGSCKTDITFTVVTR